MTPDYAKFLITQASHTIAYLLKDTKDTRANGLVIRMQTLNIHALQSYWHFSDEVVQELIPMPLSVLQTVYKYINEEYAD